jgi:hypothetical protein
MKNVVIYLIAALEEEENECISTDDKTSALQVWGEPLMLAFSKRYAEFTDAAKAFDKLEDQLNKAI